MWQGCRGDNQHGGGKKSRGGEGGGKRLCLGWPAGTREEKEAKGGR